MKKKLLILFPDEWLAYSPTVLNIAKKLSESFDLKVIALDDGSYKNEKLSQDEIEFIKINKFWLRVKSFMVKNFSDSRFYKLLKLLLIFNRVKNYQADEVIAVDSAGLWVAQKLFKRCHFLSLELYKDVFFKQCNPELIDSVIIQSQERYDYLFGDLQLKTFFIQNAPPFKLEGKTYQKPQTRRAIYFGNVIPKHGIYFCIEAVRNLKDISLTIKGTISKEVKEVITTKYSELLQSGKIEIDDSYVNQEDVIDYLSKFYVGFCFYDLNLVKTATNFNVISIPSGKLFNYYAAGVPVIGSDLPGLKSVKDFKAGILLKDISVANIATALESINSQHEEFSENCFKAAAHFDFDKAVEPFKTYLLHK